MNFDQIQNVADKQFTRLLLFFICLFLFSTLVYGEVGVIIIHFVFVLMLILLIRKFIRNKGYLFIYIILAIVPFSLKTFFYLTFVPDINKGLAIVSTTINIVFLVSCMYLMSREIFLRTRITHDTVQGGICMFFFIGILWAMIYEVVDMLVPDAFAPSTLSSSDWVYFSFTTLTTLGYGDITPVHKVAKVLTNLQAIVGLMYPAVFIARLVGLYTAHEMRDR